MEITRKDFDLAELAYSLCDAMRRSNEYEIVHFKRLNKCHATITTLIRRDTDIIYHILKSYETDVAIICYVEGAVNCISFTRIAYGKQAATTKQHIHKFMKLYNVQYYTHD